MKLSLIAIAATACADPKSEAYEHVARRLNPTLLVLRPIAARVHTLEKHRDVVEACSDASDLLSDIRRFDFGARDETEILDDLSIVIPTQELGAGWWRFSCMRDRLDPLDRMNRVELCWTICEMMWKSLENDVEQLRYCAKQEGVEIASLGGVADPKKKCP